MRVAYVYESAASDINVQSGHPYSILKELERKSEKVFPIFPLDDRLKYIFAPRYAYYRARDMVYRPDREPLLLRSLARQVERRLKGKAVDVLFCPGSHLVGWLDLPIPTIFCADATFRNVVGFYDSFRSCAPEYLRKGHDLDRRALSNCSAAIYPSQWAADSAVRDYGADPGKVHVVPFGANIDEPDAAAVASLIGSKSMEHLHILFIGREWERKGADLVLDACAKLAGNGVSLSLHVVGIDKAPVPLPAFAKSYGLLRKDNPSHAEIFRNLLEKSHFLFVPSRAENYGMVFCEAAAFGIPSVTSSVGGIPTIVKNGETGICLGRNDPADRYASAILDVIRSASRYRDMATRCSRDYRTRLSWSNFGDRLMQIAQSVV